MSSTSPWFSATASFTKSVEIINQIPNGKLNKLLNRVISKIHLRDERAFTPEEEDKLQGAFGMSAEDLDCVLTAISFIFEQAVYHHAKPNVFKQQLLNVNFAEEQSDCFVQNWLENALEINQVFRKRSVAPKQLENVNWELRLQTASANQLKMKEPTGILELSLAQADSEEQQKLLMQFSHEQLFNFFKQLETIQSKLDMLSN